LAREAAGSRAVEPLREQDVALADDLTARVRGYRFDEILDWIEPFDAATRPDGGRPR
jgi:hypothetical protein